MADTSEWLVRALFLLIGGGIGYGVRAYQVERENRRRIEAVEQKVDVRANREDGRVNLRGVLPMVALAATLVAVILTGNTNARVDAVATCSESAITETVTALNERNNVTGDQLERQRELNVEQRRFLTELIPMATGVQRQSLEDYIKALDEAIRAIDRLRQKRLETSYPTEESIKRCVRNGIT